MKYFLDTEFLEGTQDKRFLGVRYGQTKPTIDLISVGIVAEDGREYYAISKDFNLEEAWNRFDLDYGSGDQKNQPPRIIYWIRENVLKPIFDELHKRFISEIDYKGCVDMKFQYDNLKHLINKYGKSNQQIAQEIKEFVYKPFEDLSERFQISEVYIKDVEFYGYYSNYDWVVFCWLFGKMIDLPNGFPMYCKDLKQELDTKVKSVYISNGKQVQSQIQEMDNRLNWLKSLPHYPKQTNSHDALSDARWNFELFKFLQTI